VILRLLACGVFGAAANKAAEYTGVPALSYQWYALLVTLIVLSYAYMTALGQEKDTP
jgi:hypothetical protein